MLTYEFLPSSNGDKAASAVILLHGLGDSGAGLIGLGQEWRAALPDTAFYAPNAPAPCDMAPFGYQWFSAQDWTPPTVLEGIKTSSEPLNGFIDFVAQEQKIGFDKIALVGFSQGSMMSLYVAPRREQNLAGVVGYSGALFGGEGLVTEKKSNTPILLIHGTADDVVPFSAMARAEQGLKMADIPVVAMACPHLGHSIDMPGLKEGGKFLRKSLGYA